MSFRITHLVTAALLGAGGLVWALTSHKVGRDTALATPVNPFGICRSPYGEVFAMAMQSPIDVFWHGRTGEEDHDHDHGSHACDENCDHEDHDAPPQAAADSDEPFRNRFRAFLEKLESGVKHRTNHQAVSPAFDLYLRRQIEDKLKFAYQLDPAHYSNYNTYHFFLTQPSLGTRPQLTPEAIQLAEQTITYCLRDENDPRPSLTAAGATSNILELLFTDQRSEHPHFTLLQIKQNLDLLDTCIARYRLISAKWEQTGNWELLSPMRVQECRDRYAFILKIRQSSAQTLERLEQKAKSTPFPTMDGPLSGSGTNETSSRN